jgi:hypothetical protein
MRAVEAELMEEVRTLWSSLSLSLLEALILTCVVMNIGVVRWEAGNSQAENGIVIVEYYYQYKINCTLFSFPI